MRRPSGIRRRLWAALVPGVLTAGVLLAAACSSATYADTPVPTPTGTSATTPSPTTSSSTSPAACAKPTASYQPDGSLPTPGDMPSGSTMRRIQERGRLIAGVSADTLLLGSRNPLSGRIEGFDIDMLKAVTKAIFGRDDALELKVITAAQRISSLQSGSVDIVARAMTITCARWQEIAFSSEYYRAGQKVLVPMGSSATRLADLNGKKVCAPAGTSSMDNLKKVTGVVAVSAATHTGCLVLFQEGGVDAITGDDTVLAGLAAQDPYAKVVGGRFTQEPYGLGIAKNQVDFVRFVNAVLEDLRTDGQWKAIYNKWLAADLGPAPAPPTPVYGRTP
jgi:polar amino acid transport system substrate-binding protein